MSDFRDRLSVYRVQRNINGTRSDALKLICADDE